MDTGTYSDDEHTPPSSPDDPIYTSFGGGMFAGSQYFSINGGTFNNNHYHPPPAKAPNFRTVPMGDIDLQQEAVVNEKSGVIDRRLGHKRRGVRRVYSAKIDGRNTDLTVAMYEGDGAKEDWRRDVEMYMTLRHPNIIQMYGTASSGAMYATIFHGGATFAFSARPGGSHVEVLDLIPLHLVASASPIMKVYISACYVTEWEKVGNYVAKSPYSRESSEVDLRIRSTLWIRRSNGRLCVDFSPQPDGKNEGNVTFRNLYPREYHPPVSPSLDPTTQEAAAIHSLTLEEYHEICVFTLNRYRSSSVSSSTTISPGAVFLFPQNGQLEEGAEIAYLPGQQSSGGNWYLGEEGLNAVFMENDWTRFHAKDVCNRVLAYALDSPFNYWTTWLTQANYIFSRLRITSNLEYYVAVYRVDFRITIGNTRKDSPPGYLFLCPTTDFQTEPASFRWPDCPAYWSLDPLGVDRLSMEAATQLGFPGFKLTTKWEGASWDTSVYAGLRQFHQAKGFDPESQDVARHLGRPLYKFSREVDSPFAHVEEDWSHDGTDEGETDDEFEDAQSSVEVKQDGDESTEDSDANEDEGLLNFSTEPCEKNTAEARQEPICSTDQDPNPAELRVPSAGVTVANTFNQQWSPTSPLLLALVFSLLTYFHTLKNARILLVANTSELALSTLAAAFALFVTLRRTLNLEAKVNQQWSQELGAAGRLTIQSVLGCCGYFSPFVEATLWVGAGAYWCVLPSNLVLHLVLTMAAGLLCSNHVTYRFGKGMMPKAYRLSREAMAAIMEQYASAQIPPNPFSPNPTPAASASDLNLAGPRPHQHEEGDGYSYGYGGVEEGDERGAGGQHAKYESLDIGAARF
ncbi:hypothetical protein B0H16DRAFT_1744491 [Mycena metata]|uniref:Protein kinase domain-containing protein n=1 Tax=Mycena metata TaxID=1033252 RepID=A0AAD7MDS0_9AGAR|nr:hypothetical protein B0H16DRAFT_1744491 [Mycena metata]